MKLLFALITFLSFSLAFATDIDLNKSQFNWHATKVTGKHDGTISLKSAKLELDGDKIKGGEFIIDMNSITVDELTGEWHEKFLTHMKSTDFFDIQKFPEAKLVIKKVNGDKIDADLTIKGKTNPVTFKIAKKAKEFTGVLKFNRTKFDMIYGSGSFFKNLGDKVIHDEVVLDFKVVTT